MRFTRCFGARNAPCSETSQCRKERSECIETPRRFSAPHSSPLPPDETPRRADPPVLRRKGSQQSPPPPALRSARGSFATVISQPPHLSSASLRSAAGRGSPPTLQALPACTIRTSALQNETEQPTCAKRSAQTFAQQNLERIPLIENRKIQVFWLRLPLFYF